MKEEDFIRKKCGSRDPFRVPEGYFEHFTADLMDKLPERRTAVPVPRRFRLSRLAWYAAAAVVCGFTFCGILHFSHTFSPDDTSAYTAKFSADNDEDYAIDEYLDYAMMSNQEIAQYLTEAN